MTMLKFEKLKKVYKSVGKMGWSTYGQIQIELSQLTKRQSNKKKIS